MTLVLVGMLAREGHEMVRLEQLQAVAVAVRVASRAAARVAHLARQLPTRTMRGTCRCALQRMLRSSSASRNKRERRWMLRCAIAHEDARRRRECARASSSWRSSAET